MINLGKSVHSADDGFKRLHPRIYGREYSKTRQRIRFGIAASWGISSTEPSISILMQLVLPWALKTSRNVIILMRSFSRPRVHLIVWRATERPRRYSMPSENESTVTASECTVTPLMPVTLTSKCKCAKEKLESGANNKMHDWHKHELRYANSEPGAFLLRSDRLSELGS